MKKVYLINYNNKLHCNLFFHITDAPSTPIMDSKLPIPVEIEEQVLNGNAGSSLAMLQGATVPPLKFKAEMIDFARLRAEEVSSFHTYMSHGMNRVDFLLQHKGSENVAIYIYKKTQ